jgi:hypothetical protein
MLVGESMSHRRIFGLLLMVAGSICGLAGGLMLITYGIQPSAAGPAWGRILPLMAAAIIGIQLGRWLAGIGSRHSGT